ncbi:hypothetical protein [Paenibacillus sp. XY044]|uniref:hypothetical protein n=1 Tax=Paenibacillus sp. XY044 TaxID=2026089 RepID=UPI000B995ACB|nr:hypothetical protein [Paenibacillus sp. XY044]OZB98288.1 hypothetical protein CJP46_03755 [Paenibacillus sp. XY044]
MKYFKDCPEPGMGTWYFETDRQGVAYRQLVIEDDGKWIASNRKDEHYHFMLSEKPIETSEPGLIPITQEEFEEAWSASLHTRNAQWQSLKSLHPPGLKIEGSIEAFFPQGTLVTLTDTGAVGLADTRELELSGQPAWMYPGHVVQAVVKGYDEANQWIVLDQAAVLERRTDPNPKESSN